MEESQEKQDNKINVAEMNQDNDPKKEDSATPIKDINKEKTQLPALSPLGQITS